MTEQPKPQDAPKIIVDDDWKTQAQAEKEKLEAQAPAAAGQQGQGPQELPEASLSTLISALATQTVMSLGGMEDPQTGHRMVDLEMGKFHIDTLAVLEQKTKGNLTEDEKKLLDQALYETRLIYVEISQRVASMGRPASAAQINAARPPQAKR